MVRSIRTCSPTRTFRSGQGPLAVARLVGTTNEATPMFVLPPMSIGCQNPGSPDELNCTHNVKENGRP
jgi:hypothetical protein